MEPSQAAPILFHVVLSASTQKPPLGRIRNYILIRAIYKGMRQIFSLFFVRKVCLISSTETCKIAAMVLTSNASKELKLLRKQAGFSVRGLASALAEAGAKIGRSASSYAYYENEYKKPYLPVDLVDLLVPILAGRGMPPITERQVLRLGGPARNGVWRAKLEFTEELSASKQSNRAVPLVNADLLAEVIEQVAQQVAELTMDLNTSQRASIIAEVYRRVVADSGESARSLAIRNEARHTCELMKRVVAS